MTGADEPATRCCTLTATRVAGGVSQTHLLQQPPPPRGVRAGAVAPPQQGDVLPQTRPGRAKATVVPGDHSEPVSAVVRVIASGGRRGH